MYRIYNVAFSFFLLAILSPVIIATALALFATQGRTIFYRGERIGKDMKPFQIIKFRTLCPERAKMITADRTLPADSNIETPLGKILRETRLDELPQIINVIRGDMNICGPRPVRREIANIEAGRVAGYKTRFEVRPGMIGPAQACFGHGASKRLRARINNQAVRRPVSIIAEQGLLARIGLAIFAKAARKIIKVATGTAGVKPRKNIWLTCVGSTNRIAVKNMDRELITSNADLKAGTIYSLSIPLKSGGIRRARVQLTATETQGAYAYVALDDVSAYMIERYALGHVVVQPHILMGAIEDDRDKGPKAKKSSFAKTGNLSKLFTL